MTATGWRGWGGRASMAWALVGPTFILLVEVESGLALLDGLGILPRQLKGWQALAAGAVLVMVLAAQLSTALWSRIGTARRKLSERRWELEEAEASEASAQATSKAEAESSPADASASPSGASSAGDASRPSARRLLPIPSLAHLATDMDRHSADFKQARRILERFGLEPSWALSQLDENLGLPAARRLTSRARLLAARSAGYATVLVFNCAAVAFFLAWFAVTLTTTRSELKWSLAVFALLLVLLAVVQYFATSAASGAVVRNEKQFYPQVEAVLELHRFDLYRALAVRFPQDSSEEQKVKISAWRLAAGHVSFQESETADDREVRQEVAGLAELLRGPELVSYDGFVSWDAGDEQVELAFSREPVLDDGYTRLQVAGSRTASHAPFDITANSDGVTLTQVRNSVSAPVTDGAARTTFNFRRRQDSGPEPPELWFEISQRGRFIQLLRVALSQPSSQKKIL
jgi:hypothetical protein